MTRRQLGRATVKQVRFLRKAGHQNPETLSFETASALIGKHQNTTRPKPDGRAQSKVLQDA